MKTFKDILEAKPLSKYSDDELLAKRKEMRGKDTENAKMVVMDLNKEIKKRGLKEARSDYSNETADQAFKRNYSDIKKLIKRVNTAVEKMAKDQKKEPKNYGFAGSLGYVREELENIIQFLNG